MAFSSWLGSGIPLYACLAKPRVDVGSTLRYPSKPELPLRAHGLLLALFLLSLRTSLVSVAWLPARRWRE